MHKLLLWLSLGTRSVLGAGDQPSISLQTSDCPSCLARVTSPREPAAHSVASKPPIVWLSNEVSSTKERAGSVTEDLTEAGRWI